MASVMTKDEVFNQTHGLHVEPVAHERAMQSMNIPQPSLTDLLKNVKRFGSEGVLESATHLSDKEFEQLQVAVRAAEKRSRKGRRKS